MKTLKFTIILFLLICFQSQAQYGGGMYGNRMGLNRNMGNVPTPKKPTEPTEKEKEEQINKYVDKLKTDLKLDELQVIAIKNEVSSNTKSMEKVMKSENNDEDKTKEIEAISEKMERNISSFLNKDQKEMYKKMVQDRKDRIKENELRRK